MLDNDQSAGATPAAGGATPPQTPPAQPASGSTSPAPTEPATGDDDKLQEPGKRALEAERAARAKAEDRAKAAEKERDDLKARTQTDAEKAVDEARKAGAAETRTALEGQIRRSEVRAALSAAGITSSVLDLAVRADEFTGLKVTDTGVEGLTEAVAAFKSSRKDLFGAAAPAGSSDGGTRGATKLSAEQVRAWSKDPAEYEKHREEIFAWMSQGGAI